MEMLIAGSGARAGLQGIFGFRSDRFQLGEVRDQLIGAIGQLPRSAAAFARLYDERLAEANNPNRSDGSRAGFLLGAQQLLSTDTQALAREYFRLLAATTEDGTDPVVRGSGNARIDNRLFRTQTEADLARSLNNDMAQVRHAENRQDAAKLIEAVNANTMSNANGFGTLSAEIRTANNNNPPRRQ